MFHRPHTFAVIHKKAHIQAYAPRLYTPPHMHTSQTIYTVPSPMYTQYICTHTNSCTYTPCTEACISAHLKLINVSLTIPFPQGGRPSMREHLYASLAEQHASLCNSPDMSYRIRREGQEKRVGSLLEVDKDSLPYPGDTVSRKEMSKEDHRSKEA